MAELVRLPKLGANIEEGTVGAWRKQLGDAVTPGEPLVEIITSKATFDVEASAPGVLRAVLAPEKSNVPVGYVLAVVAADDEPLPDVAAENGRLLAEFRARAARQTSAGAAPVKATPGARRLAREKSLDLAAIPMPAGRDVLREEDVQKFITARSEQ